MSDADRESRAGTQFGPYRLRRLLGRGGMGEVYEAEDTVKDRVVALKLLPAGVSHDPVFRKRLQREAHSAGRLQEPHVVPIHDYGEIDGTMFVDMRMIDGTDLRKVLTSYGPMTPARAVAIVRQIASALDAAHDAGIMHRDVKPENVLITRDDFAYLVDFGIANAATDETLTKLGSAVGTLAYMAPERFSGGEVTYRADIYALACVLHECLTGAQPYKADSITTVITSHLMQPIPKPSEVRPGIPKAFDAVIARGMAKDPSHRYVSTGDLAVAANEALTAEDRDRAETMLQRSQAATLPGATSASQAPPDTSPAPPQWTPVPQQATPLPAATPPPGGPPTGGPPSWTAPPAWQPTAPGRAASNTGLIVGLAVAIGVIVVLVGGIGMWLITRPGSSSTQGQSTSSSTTTSSQTTTTESTTETSGTNTSADTRLFNLLPTGYSGSACQAVHPPVPDALATVDCGASSTAGGPTSARYSLFPDADSLNNHFDATIKEDSELVRCPGFTADSPTGWHYESTPDVSAGQVACGTYHNNPDVVWTKARDLLLGDAQGAGSINDLHSWWLNEA
jgi:serine/threonine kinase PknH